MRLTIALCLTATMAAAETCPPAPDHNSEINDILAALQDAPTELAARPLSAALWRYWTDAPDEASQALLDKGMERRSFGDFLAARSSFDRLVRYCPDYAEGYNQRALLSFLLRDFEAALIDLDAALAINPRHIGALSGKALTLIGLGRDEEGQAALRAALDLNPWLAERVLLHEAPGEDL